ELRALLDKRVWAPAILVDHVPGHRVYVARLLQRVAGGDARTGIFARFYHQNADRQSADDPIANRKILWSSECAHRKLTDNCPTALDDLLCQLLVLPRIGDVHTCSPDRYCLSRYFQCASMGRRIHAARHPTDDH